MNINHFFAKFFLIATISVFSFQTAYAAPKNYVEIVKPPAGSSLINTEADVVLSELTATGIQDPKPEWSDAAKKYLSQAAKAALEARNYKVAAVDLENTDNPRAIQILKLNDAVTDSITMNSIPILSLPTKKDFDWTLGEGVQFIVPADIAESESPPRYALFLAARGSWSSGGRKALMIGAALLGASVPLGGQAIRASIVDLKTGQVVWYKLDTVSSFIDIRTEEGAKAEIANIFKDLPL